MIDPAALGAVAATAAHTVDLSPVAMFLRADAVGKGVMIVLTIASVAVWAVIFDKTLLMMRLRERLSRFERAFWSGQPLDDLLRRLEGRADHPAAKLFVSAMQEWKQCRADGFSPQFVMERVDSVIGLSIARETEDLERKLPILATVGAVGPFIGLFGTVWGIINSFAAIAASQNTSLTVVAPGIAEALFATAIGLVAAIPAVMGYNRIVGDVNRYTGQVEAFAEELSGFLAKQSQAIPAPVNAGRV